MQPDDLYGLPLERFVPERGTLARSLRADGRREEAARVAGLRKPSVAAWAVNQLVRARAQAVRELFEAGDALRQAQADLLAGSGDGRALRAAGERERAAVDGLVDAARGLLTSGGHELSGAVVDRVAETLHAAALDDDAREQLREGRLERELRHVGLGLGEGAPAAPPPRAAKERKAQPKGAGARERAPRDDGDGGDAGEEGGHDAKGRAERIRAQEGAERGRDAKGRAERTRAQERAERDRAAEERAEAKRAERERAAARKAARAAEAAARRRAEKAARALGTAEERRERAARALQDAEKALGIAREEAEAAAAALRRAQADAEDTEDA